jgi:hypothetical protein
MLARIALAAALLAAAPVEAAAHCHHYSVWRFPFPQWCGVSPTIAKQEPRRAAARLTILHSVAASPVPNQEHPGNEKRLVRLVRGPDPAMPLPSLARADLDGGAADEPTRARLLLRAVLGAPDVH